MKIRFEILYRYPRTSQDAKHITVVESFDVVDVTDTITLRFNNIPDIIENYAIYSDPSDDMVIVDLDWDTGEIEVYEFPDFFEEVMAQRHLIGDPEIIQMWVSEDDLKKLKSIKDSITVVRGEHQQLANVKYEDWDLGMKVLEKMYRVACE